MNKFNSILKAPVKSWNELEKVIEQLPSDYEKGTTFEYFVKYYFILHKDLYSIENVYMRDEIPEKEEFAKLLKLEHKDHGVDGIIVRKDGKIIAYQAKFRSNRLSPTYRELATFWTESEYADFRLIIANSLELPPATERRKHQMVVLAETLDLLDELFFSNMRSLIEGEEPIQVKPPEPRDYQEQIIKDVINGFQNQDRGKLLAACGSGKTLVSKWINDSLKSKHTLFIAPSLSLIKQTLEEWTSKTVEPFTFLAVCSDQTVVNDLEDDKITLKVNEVNFPVTTSPEEIKDFLSVETELSKVIFSTYQSLDAITNALMNENFEFDLAIFDESHRTAGAKDSSMFVYALDDKFIPIKKRLFMTATERIVTPRIKKFAEQAGVEVFSMDDIEKYGNTFSELNFGTAIQKDIIADYKIVVCAMDENELFALAKENHYVQVDIEDETNSTTVDNLMKQIILAKAINDLDIRKVISYHSKVDSAYKFVNGSNQQLSLTDIFSQTAPHIKDSELYLNHVNGSMSSGQRKKILSSFATSKYGLVSNAKCLTEGVDVPAVDAVYFADPKDSTIDIIQAVGRALRKKQGEQKTSYILIPVILPSTETAFNGLRTDLFDTLHSVIQALRNQDEQLAHIIDQVNYEIGTNKRSPGKGRVNKGLQEKIMFLAPDKLNIQDFESSLQFRIGEVNKEAENTESKYKTGTNKGDRKGSTKRIFTSMGDYNMDAYMKLVFPTLEKFSSRDDIKSSSDLKFNHNNVSHTFRLGAIEQLSRREYRLTPIGMELLTNPSKSKGIFQQQSLKYHIINAENGEVLFPYRAWLKTMRKVPFVRKLEFLYCLYSLKDTRPETIDLAIEQMLYLQETYVNLDILSENNKEKILKMLNDKFKIELDFKDVWSSRSASYNQFNYFKKHLLEFEDIFQVGTSNQVLEVIPGSQVNIDNLLDQTKDLEKIAYEQKDYELLRQLYISM
ncbi:DEAD/DEAH box helicase family protein [Bacillus sp. S35]|uniref:DEAD/DEAH box helicase family protein n=1 Tax=Priestia aryabhattai TaxID=412384 RepID=UPI00190DF370|nr:DEAD/DEAH box helicase family protein [Priestia aryabhattai]MBK0009716.1 DEAD/DEAH box helicase family protein [Bacillus sp. S35]MCM3644475.1 DEAD/DEAH box helicase family protein [Priestia aryabhattai]